MGTNEVAAVAVAKLKAGAMLTDSELAELTGLAIQTLRNMRQRGEGPRWVRLGRRAVRYPAPAVRAFVEGREPAPTPEAAA